VQPWQPSKTNAAKPAKVTPKNKASRLKRCVRGSLMGWVSPAFGGDCRLAPSSRAPNCCRAHPRGGADRSRGGRRSSGRAPPAGSKGGLSRRRRQGGVAWFENTAARCHGRAYRERGLARTPNAGNDRSKATARAFRSGTSPLWKAHD
jgi:hypothetical protein